MVVAQVLPVHQQQAQVVRVVLDSHQASRVHPFITPVAVAVDQTTERSPLVVRAGVVLGQITRSGFQPLQGLPIQAGVVVVLQPLSS